MGIPERLVEVRERNGYTRRRLAEELGKPYATITKYENGEREAGSDYLICIAEKFHVTTDYLLGIENERQKEKSPAPAKAEAGEKLSIEEVINAFVKAGFVREGQDLTDADLRFIIAMGEAFSNWFESKQDSE